MTRSLKLKLAYGTIALVVVGVGVFGALEWLSTGTSPLGGPCKAIGDCDDTATRCLKPKGRNMGICTRRCETDKDCGPGLRCRAKADVDFRIRRRAKSEKKDTEKYCFRRGKRKKK